MGTAEDDANEGSSLEEGIYPLLADNYVRVMLLNRKQDRVLMRSGRDRWDLPFYAFPWGLNDDVAQCCLLFQSELGIDKDAPVFTAVVELIGQIGCKHAPGYGNPTTFGSSKLLLVEPCPGAQVPELPKGFAWRDVSFVESIENDREYDLSCPIVYEAVVSILRGEVGLDELMPDPPFQPGWFQKASDWLVAEITKDGASPTKAPVQYALSHYCGILKVESTKGPYFLKGVAAGSSEVQVTQVIANLFPQHSPDVICTSEELRAFITRGFDNRRIQPKEYGEMMRTLGTLQRESVEHVEDLIAAGVPKLMLQDLEDILQEWSEDDAFARVLWIRMPEFKKLIPTLVEMARQLDEYKLPMCMVHGDFARRNSAFRMCGGNRKDMLLHDWQFGAISHPFFDLHESVFHWGELGESKDVYFGMWSDYVSLEEAREAFKLSTILGHLLKMRGALACVRNEGIQKKFGFSVSADFCLKCLTEISRSVETWLERQANKLEPFYHEDKN